MTKTWNGTYHVAPGMGSNVGKCYAQSPSSCPFNDVAGHNADHGTQVAAAEKINEAQSELIKSHTANGSQKPVPEVRSIRDARFVMASKPVAANVNRAAQAKRALPSNKVSTRLARKSQAALEKKFAQKITRSAPKPSSAQMKKLFAVKYWMPDIHAKN